MQAGPLQPEIVGAAQQAGGGADAEAAVDAGHAAQGLAHDGAHLGRVRAAAVIQFQADVAAAAAGQGLLLVAEVAQDGVVAAGAALGPAHQLEEQVPAVGDRLRIGGAALHVALDQPPAQGQVSRGYQQQAEGRGAVASGPPGLLVVGLYRARRRQVDDAAHVGTVDAHAEGVGGDDDLLRASDEGALHRLAGVAVHAGVVGGGVPAARGEPGGLFLRLAAGGGVEDGRALPGAGGGEGLGQGGIDPGLALALAAGGVHAEGEVGPGEAAHVLRRVGGQPEALEDLVAYHRRGRGGAGQDARPGQQREKLADLHVLGPEVVAPLADAVGLVDGYERALETSWRNPSKVSRSGAT